MKNLITLLLFVGIKIVFAQNSGTLNGRIVDEKTQQPSQGATIILEGTNIGTITDSDGYFVLNNIPFQSYNVEASFLGYQITKQFNVIVKSAGNIPLIFELNELSEDLDEVIVSSNPFKTNSETPLSTQTFSVVEIETYPGGNNDITKVVQSMPGISPSIGGFRNDIIIRGGAPNETV